MTTTQILVATATLALSLSARADTLTLTLTQPDQTTATVGPLPYTATVAAPIGNTAPIFLNGDAFTLDGGYVVDDSPFVDLPATYAAGQIFSGDLFDVDIAQLLTPGTFTGTFSLLGGADASSQDVLATETFSVTVAPPISPAVTPEPCSLVLLFSGAVAMAYGSRHRAILRR